MSTIFSSEQMTSTRDEAKLRHGRYEVASTETAIDNGGLVIIGAPVSGQRDLRVCTAPAAITDLRYGLVDSDELVYSEETTKGLDDFDNPAGANLKVRIPEVDDIFAISGSGITPLTTEAAIAVGSFLIIQAGTPLLEEVAAVGGTESFVAEIIDIDPLGEFFDGRNIPMFGCQVVKALKS
jgi:hypothetical protein